MLFWARLPLILLSAMLALIVFELGRILFGNLAGLAAAFFCAFDPTVLAHSGLVTTDAGAAVFSALFLYTLVRYLDQPSRLRMLLCGLALGAALTSKFSALVLVPVAVLIVGLRGWRASDPAGRDPWHCDAGD